MRILVALGGNALLRRDEVAAAASRRGNVEAAAASRRRGVEAAAAALGELAREHEVVIAHDSGPEAGHLLELALRNRLPDLDVVSVLTQVVVAVDDPASADLVPSPEPNAIAEIRSLRVLVDSGALVICAGSGVPIALDGDGTMHGLEAVIDEDLTAALLARRLDADVLVMPTDVEGSMEPKVEAACRFAATTGRRAAIGALTSLTRLARGEAGTQVLASDIARDQSRTRPSG